MYEYPSAIFGCESRCASRGVVSSPNRPASTAAVADCVTETRVPEIAFEVCTPAAGNTLSAAAAAAAHTPAAAAAAPAAPPAAPGAAVVEPPSLEEEPQHDSAPLQVAAAVPEVNPHSGETVIMREEAPETKAFREDKLKRIQARLDATAGTEEEEQKDPIAEKAAACPPPAAPPAVVSAGTNVDELD